ncbi:MAG: MerR family transcriptional regulator [Spirochaetales bacterium]|nr:MerR family transcriptional regulator [Spirochaetales bacterium]
MQYLIKDLSRLTGLPPARIRKWQERYDILRPAMGTNGYYYYHNDDLRLLNYLKQETSRGRSISEVIAVGRSALLKESLQTNDLSESLQAVIRGDYSMFSFHKEFSGDGRSLRTWLRTVLRPLLVQIGIAWEAGHLSVTAEHLFSRWISAAIYSMLDTLPPAVGRRILCAVYPGDEHELPGLLLHTLLRSYGAASVFVGQLDAVELRRELTSHPSYERLYITSTMPRAATQLQNFKERVGQGMPHLKIRIGGAGWSR